MGASRLLIRHRLPCFGYILTHTQKKKPKKKRSHLKHGNLLKQNCQLIKSGDTVEMTTPNGQTP